eukprot:scaffold13184_cov101-Isochrysis_galbana.AAC.1
MSAGAQRATSARVPTANKQQRPLLLLEHQPIRLAGAVDPASGRPSSDGRTFIVRDCCGLVRFIF